MSPVAVGGHAARVGFPRVSGDEPGLSWPFAAVTPFSPRERG